MYSAFVKIFAKILIHLVFLPVFLISLFLGTLVFHFLDKTILFEAFESHQVYENLPKALAVALPNEPTLSEEEKAGFTSILENVPPELVQKIVESNVGQILDYLHGESSDLTLTLPVVELGIIGMNEDISWVLSEDAEAGFKQQIELLNGSIKILERALWGLFALLFVLLTLSALLSKPKILRGVSFLILPAGLLTLLFVLFEYIILSQLVTADLSGREPAEILLFQLVNALLPGIFSLWLKIGATVIVVAVLLQVLVRLHTPKRGK